MSDRSYCGKRDERRYPCESGYGQCRECELSDTTDALNMALSEHQTEINCLRLLLVKAGLLEKGVDLLDIHDELVDIET